MKLPGTHGRRFGWTRIAMQCACITMAACTTTGSGSGTVIAQGTPASFSWTSEDGGMTGTMTASLNNGVVYTGSFMQITSTVPVEALEPMWSGWNSGWYDWDGGSASGFVERYSGRVVANLADQNGARMRCRFVLNSPPIGMGGGGKGECQLKGGGRVDGIFPPT